MDGSSPPDKQPVRLSIYNQTFTLRVAGDPEQIYRAANEVDELMTNIARSGNVDSFRLAILACLHLQDRIFRLEAELDQIHSSVADRTNQLASLLDGVVEEGAGQIS